MKRNDCDQTGKTTADWGFLQGLCLDIYLGLHRLLLMWVNKFCWLTVNMYKAYIAIIWTMYNECECFLPGTVA